MERTSRRHGLQTVGENSTHITGQFSCVNCYSSLKVDFSCSILHCSDAELVSGRSAVPHKKAHLKKKSMGHIKVEIILCSATETTETHFIDEKLLKIIHTFIS